MRWDGMGCDGTGRDGMVLSHSNAWPGTASILYSLQIVNQITEQSVIIYTSFVLIMTSSFLLIVGAEGN
jgi:hypothetical protein